MMLWAVYNITTGNIERVYNGPEHEAQLQPGPGEGVIAIPAALDDSTAYVQNDAVVAKQPFPFTVSATQIIADGIDEAVITGIPAGTTVTWPDGQTDEVTDGEVAFSVDLAGTYTLRFSAIPYLDQEVTIEAVPAA